MRYALLAVLLLLLVPAMPAHAQPAPCAPGLLNTEDMVGVYLEPASPMRVQLYPCGGATVLWDNPYGRHLAMYTATDRLPGGGIVARGYRPDPNVGYLDGAYTIAFKPGEPGHLEVITANPYGELVGMYRLKQL